LPVGNVTVTAIKGGLDVADDAKTIYKECRSRATPIGTAMPRNPAIRRAATAECANAQARNRGLTQFLVRSMVVLTIRPVYSLIFSRSLAPQLQRA
jgi:hypothetical protein